MSTDSIVLMVGGTGMLGGQVVTALLSRGKRVRALVRPASNAGALEAAGVEIVRGDMMSLPSLVHAMDGADAVITTAAGYTRHSKGDTAEIDTIGNRNLADAASKSGIRRVVFTSILTCDLTPEVPHFWHKKLAEDRLAEQGVPFVSLRPGAFLDMITRMPGDPLAKGRLFWFGSANIPLTFVLTKDLAGNLADAVDVPGVEGQRIDIGWDRPVSIQEVADVAAQLLDREIRVRALPAGAVNAVSAIAGRFSPMVKDLGAMNRWFQTGGYVANPTRQREVFGEVPSVEQAITRLLRDQGYARPAD